MKRFTAFFLSIILCICCLVPVSVRAAEFQATYTSDLDLSNCKYFFICSDNSDYYLYCLNDRADSNFNGIQFFVSSDSSKSYLGITGGTVSKYVVSRFKYNSLSGFFENKNALSGSYSSGWDFYNSGSGRKILAANADIYDQDGYKIRSGDYENFLSYFTNPEQVQHVVNNYVPEEPTSEGGNSGSNFNIDFSSLTDSLKGFFDSLNNTLNDLIDVVSSIPANVSGAVSSSFHKAVTDYLSSIDNRLANILEMILTKSLLTEYLQNIKIAVEDADTHINDYLSQINVKNGVISNTLGSILTEIQSINTTLTVFCNTDFPQSVQNIIDSITDFKNTFSLFVTNFNNIFGVNFESSIRGQLNSIINSCVNISGKIGNISGSIGDISIDLKKMFDDNGYFQRIINAINAIPASIQDILEYLFIPQNDDYFKDIIDTINAKFGFIHQFIELGDVLVDNSGSFTNTPPAFKIEFKDNKYLGTVTFNLVDWSKVSDYIPYVKALTSGITLYLFIRRTRKKLPEVISGGGC